MTQEMLDKSYTIKIKPSKKTKPWHQTAVQIFFFALVSIFSINHVLKEAGIPIPFLTEGSLHAICPFGGVVSIYKFVTVGTFVQKIHDSSFILMILAFLLAIAFGPVFCGWVCPFGTFQEWTSQIGRRIFGKRFNNFVPSRLDRYLVYTRYIVLALVIYVTADTGKLKFQEADPYFALFNFWSSEVSITSFIILGVTIVLSFFVERPWCKYACPYGAVLGIFNLFRIFKVRRNASTCISCSACDRACPVNISVSSGKAVSDHRCITCLKCTSENACPVADTVDLSLKEEKKI